MELVATLFIAALFLAYSNGANDNFKGVATLYGSGAASYRTALLIGTIATFAGCLASVFLAETLLKAFSGKGLVPNAVAESQNFLLAVAAGAGLTVILATRLGFPISTTHALSGALAGAGYVMAGPDLNLSALGTAFFMPLLVSPVLAVALTMPLYMLAHRLASYYGLQKQSCVCVAPLEPVAILSARDTARAATLTASIGLPQFSTGLAPDCADRYSGKVFGVTAQSAVDSLHHFSAAALSFARGLNDTPKIAGLLLGLKAFDIKISMVTIAAAMALGGLMHAHRVAETMSKKISKMNDGQALVANLVTSMLVIGASKLGMPVSTTHVSVGAISGVGIVNGTTDKSVLTSIVMSWIATLPVAAALAGVVAAIMMR